MRAPSSQPLPNLVPLDLGTMGTRKDQPNTTGGQKGTEVLPYVSNKADPSFPPHIFRMEVSPTHAPGRPRLAQHPKETDPAEIPQLLHHGP